MGVWLDAVAELLTTSISNLLYLLYLLYLLSLLGGRVARCGGGVRAGDGRVRTPPPATLK